MIGDALALARKDLLLEVRRREVVLAMLQYVITTLVVIHFAIAGAGSSQKAAAGMLWAAILFTAVLSLNRCFAADQEEGALDALLLAPIDRAAIWLGKVLAQISFLLVMEALALPAFWLFFLQEQAGPSYPVLVAAVLLADVGIACLGSLLAGLASSVRAREVLLPALYLPFSIPLVLTAVRVTTDTIPPQTSGLETLERLGFLALYDTVFALLGWALFEYVVED